MDARIIILLEQGESHDKKKKRFSHMRQFSRVVLAREQSRHHGRRCLYSDTLEENGFQALQVDRRTPLPPQAAQPRPQETPIDIWLLSEVKE